MITVDGKTLKEISIESGLTEATVRNRYSKGYRTYRELTADKPYLVNASDHLNGKPGDKKKLCMYHAGKRMLDVLNEKNIKLTDLAIKSGVSRSTIYSFLYDGIDISSGRLMKLCKSIGVSSDYILGLR